MRRKRETHSRHGSVQARSVGSPARPSAVRTRLEAIAAAITVRSNARHDRTAAPARPLSTKAKFHIEGFDRPLVDLFDAPDTKIYLLIGEYEAATLLGGVVPLAVKEQVREMCDPNWALAKAIARPKARPTP